MLRAHWIKAVIFLTNRSTRIAQTVHQRAVIGRRVSHQIFGLASRPTLGLVYKRSFFLFAELFPLGAETLAYLGVVHLGIVLGHFASLAPRPHHKSVHWPLDVIAHGRRFHHVSGRVRAQVRRARNGGRCHCLSGCQCCCLEVLRTRVVEHRGGGAR
ncbi:hypothetical protein BpHYR1_045517 [Brachionus plicatilis]|uniref:Uncharacterized protein n=1 Tax=Brachionus plicatilis TaxID=10195 RepID=A0A3M7SGF9_BRAPC|nr:hypothetical protein BpHYR1_045517 [Brachionus plicatilis]